MNSTILWVYPIGISGLRQCHHIYPIGPCLPDALLTLSSWKRKYSLFDARCTAFPYTTFLFHYTADPLNTHLTSIFNKIGVSSRGAATRYAIEHHLA